MYQRHKIRKEIDSCLENRGYYRKCIPNESDSIFRAISDLIYSSQVYFQEVKQTFLNSIEDNSEVVDTQRPHFKAQQLASIYGYVIDVLETNHDDMIVIRFNPNDEKLEKKKFFLPLCDNCSIHDEHFDCKVRKFSSSKENQRILLAYSGGTQYDIIYSNYIMRKASMIQSILYEHLYSELFNVQRSYYASKVMIQHSLQYGYDNKFTGSAIEALNHKILPFPFKVAKALHNSIYRNIEYDAWITVKNFEKRDKALQMSASNAFLKLEMSRKNKIYENNENFQCFNYYPPTNFEMEPSFIAPDPNNFSSEYLNTFEGQSMDLNVFDGKQCYNDGYFVPYSWPYIGNPINFYPPLEYFNQPQMMNNIQTQHSPISNSLEASSPQSLGFKKVNKPQPLNLESVNQGFLNNSISSSPVLTPYFPIFSPIIGSPYSPCSSQSSTNFVFPPLENVQNYPEFSQFHN